MAYDIKQDLGKHEVTVDEVLVIDKEGDGSNYVFETWVRFEDGERAQKDLSTKSEKAVAMTRGVLKAMGFNIDSRSIDELMENPKLLAGAKLMAVVEENVWNGKVTNRIAYLNAIPKKPTAAGVSKLNAALRAAKKSNNESEEL